MDADTRERLLRAGSAVFAEHGYHRATVRQIVSRADANLAAVNYHFRGKEGLYAAVLEFTAKAALEKHPPYGGLSSKAPPEEQLRAFIHSFLRRIFDPEAVYGRLMARELIEPTAALKRIVEQVIRPLYGRLCEIVRTLAARPVPISRVELAAKSVVGQVLFFKHCAPVLERLDGRALDERDLDLIADHITAFSLEGLRGLRGRGRKAGR
jgi:AcrR family transcriptional regulator